MLIEHTWRLKERRDVDLTNNKLEFYVDLWNNFYKSELLKDVMINYIDMKSYTKSFYMISGRINVTVDVLSSEWSRLVARVAHDYFSGEPLRRELARQAVNDELYGRGVTHMTFNVKLSARLSRDSYDYVCQGGSNEAKAYIDICTIDTYATTDGTVHDGSEIDENTVFYREIILHFMDSLHKPLDGLRNSLKVIVKRKRN